MCCPVSFFHYKKQKGNSIFGVLLLPRQKLRRGVASANFTEGLQFYDFSTNCYSISLRVPDVRCPTPCFLPAPKASPRTDLGKLLHKLIERDTKAVVYFADPGKPHQRGTNENTNGLLRQYFPKGSAFASIKNSDVSKAVTQLNNQPRKRLNYLTPREYLEIKGVRFR